MRRFSILFVLGIFLANLGLNGCAFLVTPVVTEVATRAYADRTAEQQITDAKIHTRILNFLLAKGGNPVDMNTDVWRGKVMLTGTLDDPRLRDYISERIREDGRIRAFYNHVQIVSKEAKERRRREIEEGKKNEKLAHIASDVWISAKIKTQLLAAGGVKSVNYRWQVVLNHVYILGLARTPLERDQVLRIIRSTKGVKGINNYIEVSQGR